MNAPKGFMSGSIIGQWQSRIGKGESGATIVECALVLLLFLFVLFFFFQISITLFNYHLLVHGTTTVTRRLAVDTAGNVCHSAFEAQVAQSSIAYLQQLGLDATGATFNAEVSNAPNAGCVLRLETSLPLQCFFCAYIGDFFRLTTQNEVLIEDECFDCECTT